MTPHAQRCGRLPAFEELPDGFGVGVIIHIALSIPIHCCIHYTPIQKETQEKQKKSGHFLPMGLQTTDDSGIMEQR
jgi:hypothetical protein